MSKLTTGQSTPRDETSVGAQTDAVTVLLTDDDDAFRETERLWLARDDSWETREAANGEEALAALDASVEVLVLDQHMPAVSGPEVVARLDETTFEGDVVVVSASRLDERLTRDDVVAATLDKPVDREEFVATLTRTVR